MHVRWWTWTLALVAGCGLFGGSKKSPPPPRTSTCPPPTDPALIGISPELRNRVLEAAGRGVVVVHYQSDGCLAALHVEPNCKLKARYHYAAGVGRRSAVIRDLAQLFEAMPLHAGGLTRALEQYGALRVDEEVVGRLEAPDELEPDRTALAGDCTEATHIAVAIELGGASVVAGPTPTVDTERNWFLRPTQSKTNPAPLQYLGRVSTCREAESAKKRTPGCDHPLRVQLIPIGGTRKPIAVAPPPPSPPPPPPDAPPPPHSNHAVVVHRTAHPSIAIPAGEFSMGNAKSKGNDSPLHAVQLSAYEIDRTEVTAAAYASCVAAGACTPPGTGRLCTGGVAGKEQHPINCVTWKQAVAYCASVSARLPTEAEWERAARGTDGRRFIWGDDWPPPKSVGNFADRTMQKGEPEWRAIDGYDDGHRHTAPVGEMAESKSPVGAVDMAGNVQEWVSDWFDPHGYGRKKRVDPKGPPNGKARVVRGGSFGHAEQSALEVTRRQYYLEDFESGHIGFRCAK